MALTKYWNLSKRTVLTSVHVAVGWHGEQRLPAARRGVNRAKIQEQKDVIVTAGVLGMACLLTAGSAMLGLGDNPQFALVLVCLAAVLTTGSFVPQAMLTLRTRDVSGVSLAMYSAFTLGVLLWLLYLKKPRRPH